MANQNYSVKAGNPQLLHLAKIDEVPKEQAWLYRKLEEMRNPPFATILGIVAKVYAAVFIIGAVAILAITLLTALILGGSLTAFMIWISKALHTVTPIYHPIASPTPYLPLASPTPFDFLLPHFHP